MEAIAINREVTPQITYATFQRINILKTGNGG